MYHLATPAKIARGYIERVKNHTNTKAMKIYKLELVHPHKGCLVSYHESERAAIRFWKRENQDCDRFSLREYDIKPTKEAVLRFLNNHTPSEDNG